MYKDLLLPRDKYEEVMRQYGSSPFTFEIEKNGQALYYFGANHSHDPSNHQYPILRDYWNKFVEVTKETERIALNEGGLRKSSEDEVSAIVNGSEAGLLTYLANKESVAIASPELSDSELLKALPQYSVIDFLLYWFLHFVNNYQTHADPKPNFNESMKRWFKYHNAKEPWNKVDFTMEEILSRYKKIAKKDFSELESQKHLINPYKNIALTNEISRNVGELREVKIVSEIENYWKSGKSIFIAYGSGHLIVQRPALERLLT